MEEENSNIGEEIVEQGFNQIEKSFDRDDLEKRKEKIFSFLKEQKEWVYYSILALIVFVSVYIRSRNISKLKDIVTGTWTLGPDLDPFLFLRWAEYIVEHGKLMAVDMMRNVPLGFNTAGDMKLLSYMIAWFYKFLAFFSNEVTVTYAAVVFPVVMAVLTAIAFFLFARKIFYKENEQKRNIIALIATAFFVLIPSLLPRTIAGIPEKESAAFFFMFMAFYFILEAITSDKTKKWIIFSCLAGVFTALMALIWGGVIFIFFAVAITFLLSFILGKVRKKEFLIYTAWLASSFIIMMPFSVRYNVEGLVRSTSTGVSILIWLLMGAGMLMMNSKKSKVLLEKIKLPKELSAVIVSGIILLIIGIIILGPSFFMGQIANVKSDLISPQTTRWGLTVAENKQPYFGEWASSFGPVKWNIPLYFWLFFVGAIALFTRLIKKLTKKEKIILTFSYFIFLFGLIFSRYSSSSSLNGINGLSLFVYFGAWILFLGTMGYVYDKRYKEGKLEIFQELNMAYIMYLIIFTLGLIGARGGIRLIMVLGAVSPVAVAFLIFKNYEKFLGSKEEMKFFIGIIFALILIASMITLVAYYKADKATAENFAPGAYQWQWQRAMDWVRENTPEDAVFAHWWDYGYWVQNIGNRATVLDGGNAIDYWNHLMGRYVLTGTNKDLEEMMDFLYSHGTTHLLIDSTDIGKYTAFSSIGSDEDYDRFSWIQPFLMDSSQIRETNTGTTYIYAGGIAIDEDIVLEKDGNEILLPRKGAAAGAVTLAKDIDGNFKQPEVIFVYNNQQYTEKLRYAYVGGELLDFESGLNAGVFVFPRIEITSGGGANANEIGALLYLSGKTIDSNIARLYLFNEKSENFKLVHTEPNVFIDNLREQGVTLGDFVYYNGLQGPIKIWEINYPSNAEVKDIYLQENYPNLNVTLIKPGEY